MRGFSSRHQLRLDPAIGQALKIMKQSDTTIPAEPGPGPSKSILHSVDMARRCRFQAWLVDDPAVAKVLRAAAHYFDEEAEGGSADKPDGNRS